MKIFGISSLYGKDVIQWRAEVSWCPGRLLDCIPPSQILQLSSGVWWSLLLDNTLLVTSQYEVIFTFANQRYDEVCWHNMHKILNALSFLIVVQCVNVINTNYQCKLGDRSKTLH